MNSAEPVAKPTVSNTAADPARLTPAALRAPKFWPTRTAAAWPRPSGTENASEAICNTAACASTDAMPKKPMTM